MKFNIDIDFGGVLSQHDNTSMDADALEAIINPFCIKI